ncbi:MAG: pyridoxal phosphate-dependent aminotransferase [Acidobacteriota bacterium]
MRLSDRIERIGRSATMAAGDKAARMRRQGVDVLDLGPGQPDFDTPEHIVEAGIRALREGKTRYTAAAGIPELREAVAQLYLERDGAEFAPEETIISCGGKQAIHNAVMALVNDGDDVILPTPYWVSFPEQIKLAGGNPVFVETREEDDFELRADAVADVLTERTRLIIVNTPSNPSGAVVSRREMEALTRLALEHEVFLLLDECYATLVYDGWEHVTPLQLGPEAKRVTLICGSCSKSYAMTGWRIGWMAGPRPVIDAMGRMQGHTTSNPTSISQWAALEALTGDQTPVREMLEVFAERRERTLLRLRNLPGVTCGEPGGAFYAFPNVESLLGDRLPSSADLSAYLLEKAHVMSVPGTAFGRDGYLRLSFATSTEVIDAAMDRLEEACADLLG